MFLVEFKLIGQDQPFEHCFNNIHEVKGWAKGLKELADYLGFSIEYMTLNGEEIV